MINLFLLNQSVPLAIVIILFLLIIFTTAYFLYVYKKEKQFEEKEEQTLSNYSSILSRAHKRARSIMRAASDTAKNLLVSTSFVKEQALENINQSIAAAGEESKKELAKEEQKILAEYESSLETIKHESLESINKIASAIQNATKLEMDTFRDALRKQLVATQMVEEQKMTDEFEKAKADIAMYKKQKLQKIDEQIEKIVIHASEKVIARSLTIDDHQRLVLDILEEAKNEGFFDI
jgi:Ca2+/Na+ antiporter